MIAPPDLKGKVASVFSGILGLFFLMATLISGYAIDAYGSKIAFSVLAICHILTQIIIGLYSSKWKIPDVIETVVEPDLSESLDTLLEPIPDM